MNDIRVSLDEVLRHFLRKQSHKRELQGIDVEHYARPEDLIRSIPEYECLAERILRCNWSFCPIDKDLFASLRAVHSPTWSRLSGGALKISDIAASLMNYRNEFRNTVATVLGLQELIINGLFDWRIVIEHHKQDYTILDGVSRAIAMARHFAENGFESFYAYVGKF